MSSQQSREPNRQPKTPPFPTAELCRVMQGMRHGVVSLVIQDGHVVQLDVTQKTRLI